MRTNYRLTGGPSSTLLPEVSKLATSGVIAQGSYESTANTSGYFSVAHGLYGTPRYAEAAEVTSAALGVQRQINVKGIDKTYVTFQIASLLVVSALTVQVVWNASL